MYHETLKKFQYPKTLLKEYNSWILLLRPQQVTLGSLVLVSKSKEKSFRELSSVSYQELSFIFKDIEFLLKDFLQCQQVNYLSLMMVDPQVHFHIIPRYDQIKTWDLVEFQDKSWPHPPNLSEYNKIDLEVFARLREALKKELAEKSTKKYRNVYTTGVFDLLHPGHINILKKSKELAEHLIVGVSTDELVLKEKDKLPAIPFEQRVEMLESLRFVDEVIPQKDKNKESIVEKYEIEAITVGSDWKGRYPTVSCDLMYFDYTSSVSSTLLRERILKKQQVDLA
jgi:glycerol-3-phosphate cytidylyltransferase